MAIFKCMLSGNTVEFLLDHDIEQMREHPQYEELYEDEEEQVEEVKKTRGRKPKVEE